MADSIDGLLRARATRFWVAGPDSGWWPVEPANLSFLGNVTLALGAATFPDWRGDEPAQAALPILDGSSAINATGFDMQYALLLLARHGNGPIDAQAFVARRKDTGSPLTPAEWHDAIDFYNEFERTANLMALQRVSQVRRLLSKSIAGGLPAYTRNPIGGFRVSPSDQWQTEFTVGRFDECQMNPDEPLRQISPGVVEQATDALGPILWPGFEWIFLDRQGVHALVQQTTSAHNGSAAAEENPKPKEGKLSRTDRVIEDAIQANWGGKIPPDTQPQLLKKIQDWASDNDLTPPSIASLQRYLAKH